jgi:hypothetical protein
MPIEMATCRSLNKLERKAHMSLHNTVEVMDEPGPAEAYTRDRFGKRHAVPFLAVFLLASAPAWAASKGTNVQVDSGDLEPFSLNRKTDPDDRFKFYEKDSTSVGFNENGDPSLNLLF